MSVTAVRMNSTGYAISGGYGSAGGVSNSTNYSAVSVVGKPFVGYSNSTSFSLYSGIFYPFTLRDKYNATFDPCDLNYGGIVYRDRSDLISAYKRFHGMGSFSKVSYWNRTAIKEEYACFVNGQQNLIKI